MRKFFPLVASCFFVSSVAFAAPKIDEFFGVKKKEVKSSKEVCGSIMMIISAPSGTGKTVAMQNLISRYPNIVKIASVTTRPMRSTEVEGVDYKFITLAKYKEYEKKGRLIEKAVSYGNYYGVLADDIIPLARRGVDMIFDLNVDGVSQIKRSMPGFKVVYIYIMPPSIDELAKRLKGRGTDSDDIIQSRMSRVMQELKGYDEYDYIITSTNLNSVVDELETIYKSLVLKRLTCIAGEERMNTIQSEYDSMMSSSSKATAKNTKRSSVKA